MKAFIKLVLGILGLLAFQMGNVIAQDIIIFDDAHSDSTTANFPYGVYAGGGDQSPRVNAQFPFLGAPEGEFVVDFTFNRQGGWSGIYFQSAIDTIPDQPPQWKHELNLLETSGKLSYWVYSSIGGSYYLEIGDRPLGWAWMDSLDQDKAHLTVRMEFIPNEWVHETVDWFAVTQYSPYHRPESVAPFDYQHVGCPFLIADPGGAAVKIGEFDVYFDDVRFLRDSNVVEIKTSTSARKYQLVQNYPNPFRAETIITCQIPESAELSLKVFNILGQEIKTLLAGVKPAGEFSTIWDGKDNQGHKVPKGIYFYQIQAGDFVATKKMVFLP